MRKIACVILLALYVMMSGGVVFHYNYCRGKLTAVSVWTEAKCPRCAAKKSCCGKCGCCEERVEVVKVEIDQAAAQDSQGCPNSGVFPFPVPALPEMAAAPAITGNASRMCYLPPPPGWGSGHIPILFCSLVI